MTCSRSWSARGDAASLFLGSVGDSLESPLSIGVYLHRHRLVVDCFLLQDDCLTLQRVMTIARALALRAMLSLKLELERQ